MRNIAILKKTRRSLHATHSQHRIFLFCYITAKKRWIQELGGSSKDAVLGRIRPEGVGLMGPGLGLGLGELGAGSLEFGRGEKGLVWYRIGPIQCKQLKEPCSHISGAWDGA
jgi:hypothetical protein